MAADSFLEEERGNTFDTVIIFSLATMLIISTDHSSNGL